MADHARQSRPDLEDQQAQIGFFELLRQLETEELRFGRSASPETEPARLGQTARLSFATSDIAQLTASTDDQPATVEINAIGLLGPEGPMPLHVTRWIMARLSNRWFAGDSDGATSDTAFLNFCNLLQHRMMGLYWRAWADAQPQAQITHDPSGRAGALLDTLAGVGLPGPATQGTKRRGQKIKHATALAHQVQSPDRLTDYLSDVLGTPITLKEFVGAWTNIPAAQQSRLGSAFTQLDATTVIGSRTFERANRMELQAGPMSFASFTSFFEDKTILSELRHATKFAIGDGKEVDLRLILCREEVPQARLGQCQLSRTTWLNPDPEKDPDDMRLSQIIGKASNQDQEVAA